jgi:hypothetical protein
MLTADPPTADNGIGFQKKFSKMTCAPDRKHDQSKVQ